MALQGSLDDVALADVLTLLATTGKTGELRLDGGVASRGRVWLLDGLVVAAESSVAQGADTVDVLFELLRLERGTFLFTAGVHASRPGEPCEVAPLLDEARGRLSEWRAIEAVVPSLSTRVALVPVAPGPTVVVEAATWPVLVAVASGGTVTAVADALDVGEFGACRAVKALVDAGLATVGAGAGPDPASPAVAPGDTDPVPAEPAATERFAAALREVEGDPVLTAEEVAAAGEAGLIDENGDPINRSVLLKFLSSVRS